MKNMGYIYDFSILNNVLQHLPFPLPQKFSINSFFAIVC